MTRDELAARIDGLLVAMGEPSGTIEVFTRADAIFGREAVVRCPADPLHVLTTSAMGEDDEGACDLAWVKLNVAVDRRFDFATKRLARAESTMNAASLDVAEWAKALQRAGALRRAVRS